MCISKLLISKIKDNNFSFIYLNFHWQNRLVSSLSVHSLFCQFLRHIVMQLHRRLHKGFHEWKSYDGKQSISLLWICGILLERIVSVHDSAKTLIAMTETRTQHFSDWPSSKVDLVNSETIRQHKRMSS